MTLPSLALFLVVLSTTLPDSEGAAVVQRRYSDSQGNIFLNSESSKEKPECCIIPTCDQFGLCHETLSCGYICSRGQYRPATTYGFTPGYQLKDYYMKQDCHFGECQTYKYLCNHCPNPKEHDFSIYTVRRDCKSCYQYSL